MKTTAYTSKHSQISNKPEHKKEPISLRNWSCDKQDQLLTLHGVNNTVMASPFKSKSRFQRKLWVIANYKQHIHTSTQCIQSRDRTQRENTTDIRQNRTWTPSWEEHPCCFQQRYNCPTADKCWRATLNWKSVIHCPNAIKHFSCRNKTASRLHEQPKQWLSRIGLLTLVNCTQNRNKSTTKTNVPLHLHSLNHTSQGYKEINPCKIVG